MYNQNQMNSIMQANTSINIQSLSPKQLLGQCIDLAASVLRDLVNHYIQSNKLEYPFGQKIDLSAIMNYILQPSRLQSILEQYTKSDDKGIKTLIKNWLHQLKYFRNCWAHSQSIDHRFAIRSFDTLSLLFEALSGNKNTQIYHKIQSYRRNLLTAHVKTFFNSY